jgi:hypothetical protein
MSFSLLNTQEKLLWISLYHVSEQGEGSVLLVVVTSTEMETTILGPSRPSCGFTAQCTHIAKELNTDDENF